jgi:hypothetical protein
MIAPHDCFWPECEVRARLSIVGSPGQTGSDWLPLQTALVTHLGPLALGYSGHTHTLIDVFAPSKVRRVVA